jgi:hypothetical protein
MVFLIRRSHNIDDGSPIGRININPLNPKNNGSIL